MRTTTWIFILGCNDSGTSLYYHLLGLHPDISRMPMEGQFFMFGSGDVKRITGVACDRVWTEQLQYFVKPDLDVEHLRKNWIKTMQPGNTNNYLVKSPPDMVRSYWLQKHFKPAKFLGIVRNGYSTTASIMSRGYSLGRAATHWNLAYEILLQDANRLEYFKLLKYEDLAENPERCLYDIETFLGIKHFDYSFLDSYILKKVRWNKNRKTTAGEEQIRGVRSKSKIFNMNMTPRKLLSLDEITEIGRLAHGMLDCFKYEPPIELLQHETGKKPSATSFRGIRK